LAIEKITHRDSILQELDLFEREARVLKSLNHPGIPAYIDYFQVCFFDAIAYLRCKGSTCLPQEVKCMGLGPSTCIIKAKLSLLTRHVLLGRFI